MLLFSSLSGSVVAPGLRPVLPSAGTSVVANVSLPPATSSGTAPPQLAPATVRSGGLNVTHNFMPWVCQFCTWSGSNASFAAEYAPYASNMTQLSSEMYDLCTTSPYFCSRGYEDTSNDLTGFAHKYHIAALPMLTSATLSTIQDFVNTPSEWTPFITQAVDTAVTYGYQGYNIDWEPSSDTTVAGGYEMAHFLDQFANASHAKGLIITQDFARWDPNFWNLAAYAQTTVDTEMDMNYACPGSTFTDDLTSDVATFKLSMLGEALDPEENPCTDAQMVSELSQVQAAGVANIEWWALDDTTASLDNAHEWTAVHDFVYDDANNGTTSQSYDPGSWGLNVNEHPVSSTSGDLSLFTLGTDEQGYADASLASSAPITSATITMQVSFNPSNYHLYEGNVSAAGTVISSWVLPDRNGTLSLGAPTGGTATSIFFELASDPGGSVGGYQVGFNGTYADFQVALNSGGGAYVVTASSPTNRGTVGVPVNLTSSVAGGTAPYTFTWRFGDGTSSTGRNASHDYPQAGTYDPMVFVNDSAGHSGSASLSLLIDPAVAVSASADPASGGAPLTVEFTAIPSGGSGTYTGYAWSFGDGSQGSGSSSAHTYTAAGTYSATVRVTDTYGASATSAAVQVIITSSAPRSLAVTLQASSASGKVGQVVTFTASPSGGTLPFTYTWSGVPTGCSGQDTASFECAPTAPGEFVVQVTVTDSGSPAQHATAVAYYNATSSVLPLSGYLAASSPNGTVGTDVSFAAVVSGGTLPYHFVWTGLPTGCDGSDTSSVACVPTVPGTYRVQVNVSDSSVPSQTASWWIYYNASAAAPAPQTSATPTILGMPTFEFLLVIAAVAGVAVVAVVAVALSRRRSPPADDPYPSGQAPPYPPTP